MHHRVGSSPPMPWPEGASPAAGAARLRRRLRRRAAAELHWRLTRRPDAAVPAARRGAAAARGAPAATGGWRVGATRPRAAAQHAGRRPDQLERSPASRLGPGEPDGHRVVRAVAPRYWAQTLAGAPG